MGGRREDSSLLFKEPTSPARPVEIPTGEDCGAMTRYTRRIPAVPGIVVISARCSGANAACELEENTCPGSITVVALVQPAERANIVRLDEGGIAVETKDASAGRNGFEREINWSGGDVWVCGRRRVDTEEGESGERDEDLGELHGSSCVACQNS